MKRIVLLLAFGQFAWQLHAQSTCATALPVTLGTYTVDAVNGTEVPAPVCTSGGTGATHGKWYAFTATIDTAITVTTDLPGNGGLDTRVNIYTGDCGALVCLAGDDDSGSGYLSTVTFDVTAGTVYTIAFDDRWSATGFQFEVMEALPQTFTPAGFTPQTITITGTTDCIVDMNNDGLDDEVDVTATSIHINYQLVGGGFQSTTINTAAATNIASWSLCAGDLDGNGYNDLMYGGGNGVTLMIANSDGTAYTPINEPDYIFCQRTNMVDINNDGHLDAFSCHDIAANCYYLNDGSNNFVFHQGGLGEDCGNYGSIWIDIDNDHKMDLFVAKCGCDPVDILYHNNGDGTFTNMAAPLGLGDSQQSWSSAWGDFDNDGDMDVLVGTSSGDYQKLMRNDGSVFTNVTPGSGFDLSSGVTSIDWVAHDFDNDGYVDVLGGHTMFKNNGNMTFTAAQVEPGNGPIGDVNNDGFLDIQNGDIIYMNAGDANHYLTVRTIGTVSNKNGIGARVQVTSALGTQIRDIKSGDQFHFMSTLNAHFGLGLDSTASNVTVYWPSGLVSSIDNPAVDTMLTITEDVSAGVQAVLANELSVFPSPTEDVLNIRAAHELGNSTVVITDMAGKEVASAILHAGAIDVSALRCGIYLLRMRSAEGLLRGKFVKQ